jgi:hypothetical protein
MEQQSPISAAIRIFGGDVNQFNCKAKQISAAPDHRLDRWRQAWYDAFVCAKARVDMAPQCRSRLGLRKPQPENELRHYRTLL